VIVLSAEERAELERRAAAYSDSYCRVVRAKIVLMAADGMANAEIAARLDTSPQVVHRWRKRFFEQRLTGLEDRPRSGRPRVFSPLSERRNKGVGVRAAGHYRRAAFALELRRVGPGVDHPWRGGGNIGGNGVADTAL
jgi:transposase-like protein